MNLLHTKELQKQKAKEYLKTLPLSNGAFSLFDKYDVICAIISDDDNIYPLIYQKRMEIMLNHQLWIPYLCIIDHGVPHYLCVSSNRNEWDKQRWVDEKTTVMLLRQNVKEYKFEPIMATVDLNNGYVSEEK